MLRHSTVHQKEKKRQSTSWGGDSALLAVINRHDRWFRRQGSAPFGCEQPDHHYPGLTDRYEFSTSAEGS
jgi:hypothetical protein